MIEPREGISTVARSGWLSLRRTTATANTGSYQDITGLIPGRAYQFVAWVRAESGEVPARVKVSDTTGANTVSGSGLAYDSIWWTITAVFTATAEGVAKVHLAKHDTTGAQLWDDVELVNGATAVKLVRPAYYPYGQERGTATENDTAKFGTYTRDAATGLDYAMNRYYQSTWGRFTSPDPYRASGGPGDPGSWNRYAYVQGDPVNRADPSGLYYCAAEFGNCLMQWDAGLLSTGGVGWGPTLGGLFNSPWALLLPTLPIIQAPAPPQNQNCSDLLIGLPDSTGHYRTRPRGRDYYGQPEVVNYIAHVGTLWDALPDREGVNRPRIGITGISFQNGGQRWPSVSHLTGLDVDVRPVRNDGLELGTTINAAEYDRGWTQELINLFRDNLPRGLTIRIILFGDTNVRGATYWPDHADHFHISFSTGRTCNWQQP